MTIIVPKAPTQGGRAARVQEAPTPRIGAAVAGLGDAAFRLGTQMETERLDQAQQRVNLDLQKDLDALHVEFDTSNDPEAFATQWEPRLQKLKQSYLEGTDETGRPRLDPKLRDRFDLTFDALAAGPTRALGRRQPILEASYAAASYQEHLQQLTVGGGSMLPEDRAAATEVLRQRVDADVKAGHISPEQGAARYLEIDETFDNQSALRMLSEDPATLVTALDGGAFANLDPVYRENLRNRANAQVLSAADAAARAADQAARQRASQIGDDLNLMATLADADITPAQLAKLDDPEYQQHPNYAKALSRVQLMAERPNLMQQPLAAVEAALAAERAKPGKHEEQAHRVGVLEGMVEQLEAGWAGDQIAFAQSQGLPVPDLDTSSADSMAAGVRARMTWAQGMAEQGYTDSPRLFSDEEREAVRGMIAVDADPAQRLSAIRAIAGAAASPTATQEILGAISDDPVVMQLGMLSLVGAPQSTLSAALQGQAELAQGNVVAPRQNDRLALVIADLDNLLFDLPGRANAEEAIRLTADALYANELRRTGGKDAADPAVQEKMYRQAMHLAQGGTGTRGSSTARGGIQEIDGQDVILPPGVAGSSVEAALDFLRIPSRGSGRGSEAVPAVEQQAHMARALEAVSLTGGVPELAGGVIPFEELQKFDIQAIGNDRYVFVRETAGGREQLFDGSSGGPYVFSLRKLLREARQ